MHINFLYPDSPGHAINYILPTISNKWKRSNHVGCKQEIKSTHQPIDNSSIPQCIYHLSNHRHPGEETPLEKTFQIIILKRLRRQWALVRNNFPCRFDPVSEKDLMWPSNKSINGAHKQTWHLQKSFVSCKYMKTSCCSGSLYQGNMKWI